MDQEAPAREFGLVFRADATGDQGMFASVIPGRFSAELVKYVHNHIRGPQSIGRGRTVEQSSPLAVSRNGHYRLEVIAFGPSIEINVNGRLVLARMNMPRRRGRVGLFSEDGRAAFSNIAIQPLQAPTCHWNP